MEIHTKFKYKNLNRLIFGLGALLLGLTAFFQSSTLPKLENLSQEELAALVKPAVVKIIQHVDGQASLPDFEVNIKEKKLVFIQTNAAHVLPIDDYFSGSGFLINPDGYILTNSHVISSQMAKEKYLDQALVNALAKAGVSVLPEDLKQYFFSQAEWQKFYNNSLEILAGKSNFILRSKITVLDPTATQEDILGLISRGFETEIISINEDFSSDEKDIGLIKIKQTNLPSLILGDSGSINVGQKIYILGFPVTADLNQRSPLEASFTQGLVSAMKFSENKAFKIFQTDAKISQGSSGGPLFNEKGEAVGIVTFETGQELRQAGDNFAFAIPLEIARNALKKHKVENTSDKFSLHLKNGLMLLRQKECRQAMKEFNLAGQSNVNFGTQRYVETFIRQCEALTIQGKSVDTFFKKFSRKISNLDKIFWLMSALFTAFAIFSFKATKRLDKQIKEEAEKLNALEQKLQDELAAQAFLEQNLNTQGTVLPLPGLELHSKSRRDLAIAHPHLTDYIKQARAVGLNDNFIELELKKTGWDEVEIGHAFKAL